jgi:hypothetical protein
MDQLQLLQFEQCGQHLLHNRPDAGEGQRRELVLLEEVVEVLLQHLEHQTGVALVLEALVGPHEVELLRVLVAQLGEDGNLKRWMSIEKL